MDPYFEQEDVIEEHVVMNSQQPMSGFISPEELRAQDQEEMEPEQPGNPQAHAELSSTPFEDQLLKFLANYDSGRLGQLFEKAIKGTISGQPSGTAPISQTLFQGSSSKGKAPVSALKFRAPTASAPPPPNVAQEAGPSVRHTAPSAPCAQYTALPAPSISYVAPPALS